MSEPVASRRFTSHVGQVRAARRFLRETFEAWDLPRCADAELVISELMTNAIRHGDGPPLVRLLRRAGRVRIEVDDASEHPPATRWPPHQEPSGRGLAIIERLTLGWGHGPAPAGGKTVWAEVAVP